MQLSNFIAVLRLFVDGFLSAVNLRIYGSSVIEAILREPRFPDTDPPRYVHFSNLMRKRQDNTKLQVLLLQMNTIMGILKDFLNIKKLKNLSFSISLSISYIDLN